MSTVKIEIDRSATDGTFTNHDVIRGTIVLVVSKAITLNFIQVKLEGIASSQLRIPKEQHQRDKNRNERQYKIIRDQHKVLYDTQIVFPPNNVREVSKAKDFTLAPGNYQYPFEFTIPLNNSCVKMNGITNKVLLNLKTYDVMVNNGNFGVGYMRNKGKGYMDDMFGPNRERPPHHTPQPYHVTMQLPPSLSGLGDLANIKYFVKVTCKRSSFFKTNKRAYDPFIFLPLDLNMHNQLQPHIPATANGEYDVEYKEAFVRKELVFYNRIPEIVAVKVPSPSKEKQKQPLPPVPQIAPKKQGFFQKIFSSTDSSYGSGSSGSGSGGGTGASTLLRGRNKQHENEIHSKNVPFSFEIRFRHPAFLIPTKPPSFKLYIVSTLNPLRYTLSEFGRPDESNGLGVIYLQTLDIKLNAITVVSVVENDGLSDDYHMAQHENSISVCKNTFQNLKFDLMHGQPNRHAFQSSNINMNAQGSLFEIEIPKKYFANCVLPDHLAPSFKTCNITRRYDMTVIAGFSSERIDDFSNKKELKKIKYIELECANIRVASGLNMTSTLQSNALRSSVPLLSNALQASIQKVPTPPPSRPLTNRANGSGSGSVRKFSHSSVGASGIESLPNGHTSQRPNGNFEKSSGLPETLTGAGSANEVGNMSENELETATGTGIASRHAPENTMLPTYDDVVLESSYQDDSEHQRARRRYKQLEQYYHDLDGYS